MKEQRKASPRSPEADGERLRTAFDLHEAGVELQRMNFERRHPDASDAEIRKMLGEWLRGDPADWLDTDLAYREKPFR